MSPRNGAAAVTTDETDPRAILTVSVWGMPQQSRSWRSTFPLLQGSLKARDVLKKPPAGVGQASNVARLKASGVTLQFIVGFNDYAVAAFTAALHEFKTTGNV